MQIAQVLAGYSLGGADLLRRAMGKKKPQEMAKQRSVFEQGAVSQGVDPNLAIKIFDLVEKFAGYGFNKSHSAAYALVSYQTLWLKTHFSAEFMAAVLTADMQNTDKVVALIEECRNMELDLILPNVNVSEYTFTVDDRGRVVYGLGAIKGLGEGPVASITEARAAGGSFKNLFDFCARIDVRKVNKRAINALVRSGALDDLGPSRARMMASVEEALRRAGQNSRNIMARMDDLFGEVIPGEDSEEDLFAASKGIREFTVKEHLNGEKETLGLYLTGHPFDEYKKEVMNFVASTLNDVRPKSKELQTVVGLVVAVRLMKTKKGDTMAIVTLDDRTARIDVTLFSEAYETSKEYLVKDTVLCVEGEVSEDNYSEGLKVMAKQCFDVTGARLKYARSVRLSIVESAWADSLPNKLKTTLEPYRLDTACAIVIDYQKTDAKALIELGDEWRVRPEDDLLQGLRYLLGNDNVSMDY